MEQLIKGFLKRCSCVYLQIKQRSSSPHCFANLQVVLLPGKPRRALVVRGQNLDIDGGNG